MEQQPSRSRINITLDVDANGATRKYELPLNLLLLANVSGDKQNKESPNYSLQQDGLNALLESVTPCLNLDVENTVDGKGTTQLCQLEFHHLNDFSPAIIAKALPQTRRLLAMRNLLKDLKVHSMGNPNFKKVLSTLLSRDYT